MADLSLSAASVAPSAGWLFKDGTAGATITAGQSIYEDASDGGKAKLADANASAAAADTAGIALHGASSGQPIRYQIAGDISIGTTAMEVGKIFVQSANAGGIAPSTDMGSGWYTKVIGISKTNSVLSLILRGAGVATT